jgi:AcrR family transcriptional regulator
MGTQARRGRGEATRDQLIETATELFATNGYANVGTEEIVKRAGVTRGALYHHFADKRDLFRAVYRRMEAEIVQEIAGSIGEVPADDPLRALEIGVRLFLDACEDPARVQVGLVDAPSVLGWDEWRQVGAEHGFGLVAAALEAAKAAGQLRRASDVRTLAHLLLGALGEAGMLLAHATDRKAARTDVEGAVLAILDGLRT